MYGPNATIVRIWYQPRGGEPIPFDISEMAIPWEGCGGQGGAGEAFISSNTVVTSLICDDSREAWILTFDEVPA